MAIDWTIWAMIAGLAFLGVAARRRRRQLEHRAALRHDFFRTADALLDEVGLNIAAVDMVAFMAAHIDSRTALWRFFWHSVRGHVRAAYLDLDDQSQGLFREIMALPKSARDKCLKAMIIFIIALTYNHLVIGTFIRRVAFFAIGLNHKGSGGGSDAAAVVVSDMLGRDCRQPA